MMEKNEKTETFGRTVDHETLKVPTLRQINEKRELKLPVGPLNTLYARNIRKLADIRRVGGIHHLEGPPLAVDDPTTQTLEAHAYLELVSNSRNHRTNRKLIEAEFHNIVDIAATIQKTFLKKAKQVAEYIRINLGQTKEAKT